VTNAVKPAARLSVSAQLDVAGASPQARTGITELADRLYGHVLRAIDLGRLFQLEQCVWSELDRLKIRDDEGDLANALLAEVLHRVAYAPERHINSVPAGIPQEEIIAAEFDEACLMCQHDAKDLEYRMSGRRCDDLYRQAEDKEWRALQAQAAEQWRTKHATALRRFEVMMARRGSVS
jgi:hypothetical protein